MTRDYGRYRPKKWKRRSTSRERQRLARASKAAKLKGKEAFTYEFDKCQERFNAFAVSDRGVEIALNYPTARLFVDGTKRLIGWQVDTLTEHLTKTQLHEISGLYIGNWWIEVRPKPVRRAPLGTKKSPTHSD